MLSHRKCAPRAPRRKPCSRRRSRRDQPTLWLATQARAGACAPALNHRTTCARAARTLRLGSPLAPTIATEKAAIGSVAALADGSRSSSWPGSCHLVATGCARTFEALMRTKELVVERVDVVWTLPMPQGLRKLAQEIVKRADDRRLHRHPGQVAVLGVGSLTDRRGRSRRGPSCGAPRSGVPM